MWAVKRHFSKNQVALVYFKDGANREKLIQAMYENLVRSGRQEIERALLVGSFAKDVLAKKRLPWLKSEITNKDMACFINRSNDTVQSCIDMKILEPIGKESLRLTEYGANFGFIRFLVLSLKEVHPLLKEIADWKQVLFGAGSVGLVWIVFEFFK